MDLSICRQAQKRVAQNGSSQNLTMRERCTAVCPLKGHVATLFRVFILSPKNHLRRVPFASKRKNNIAMKTQKLLCRLAWRPNLRCYDSQNHPERRDIIPLCHNFGAIPAACMPKLRVQVVPFPLEPTLYRVRVLRLKNRNTPKTRGYPPQKKKDPELPKPA